MICGKSCFSRSDFDVDFCENCICRNCVHSDDYCMLFDEIPVNACFDFIPDEDFIPKEDNDFSNGFPLAENEIYE